MSDLADRECVPCKGGIPSLTPEEIEPLLERVEGWNALDGHHLSKMYRFRNFVDALAFVNRVGDVAEEQFHHPDLYLSWGKVWWTSDSQDRRTHRERLRVRRQVRPGARDVTAVASLPKQRRSVAREDGPRRAG